MSVKHEIYHDNYRLYIFIRGKKYLSDLLVYLVGGIGIFGGLGPYTRSLYYMLPVDFKKWQCPLSLF